MTALGLFFAQVGSYAIVPFYLTILKRPQRVVGFYVYFGILLLLSSFMGSVYSLQITPSTYISGGNIAYGALLMSTVLLVIIEHDLAIVRRILHLIVITSLFLLFLFALFVMILNKDATIKPLGVDAGIFALSLPTTILGSILTLGELILMLVLFEQIKRRITNTTILSCLYTVGFVLILCLDGLVFPPIAFAFNPKLVEIVLGDVQSKLLLGLTYSIPILLFLLVYRQNFVEYVRKPFSWMEMLYAPQAQLEEEIQRQRESLALGEEQLQVYAQRLSLATKAARLGIWELDLNTNLQVWDERCFEMYGIEPSAEIVTIDTWRERVHPDDFPAAFAAFQAALTGSDDYQAQFRVIRPDGQTCYMEAYGIMVRAPDGSPQRMIGMNMDITPRKLLEAENEQLTAQFYQAQRLESIGQLAGGIAHDFNNLLVPISSYAELGQRKTTEDDSRYNYFGRIKDAADRAAGLTRQILAFSRKQSMEMRVIDLNQSVLNFQSMMQRFIGHNVELEVELSPVPMMILADAGQIEQVLMNLVVNARDAMPEGGRFTITTGMEYIDETYAASHDEVHTGHYVTLRVCDTGIGMDAATKERVFEPFFTTKPLGQGTGLGLSTVFGIVKQHQGSIEIESETGHGSEFKIFLPARQH